MTSKAVQFFILKPGSLYRTAPGVEEAFNSERIIRAENAHLFPVPTKVKMGNKGRRWTDFLTPKRSHSPLLCSQRVVDAVESEALKGIRFLPVTLEAQTKSQILDNPFPYYWIIPTGRPLSFYIRAYHRADAGFSFWFDADNHSDPRLNSWLYDGSETPEQRRVPVPEEWDGNDLISWSGEEPVGAMGRVYCSRRFIEVAYRERWSNLMAGPVDRIGISPGTEDLTEKPWPPELWYPENQPFD